MSIPKKRKGKLKSFLPKDIKKKKKEVTFSSGGKVFSAKIPRKLNRRIEASIAEHEFESNSSFLKFAIKLSLTILEDIAKGRKLYSRNREGKLTEYKILG